jgi:hypothetical protein
MKCYYMMLRFVCGVFQVQLEFLDPFFSETINSYRYVTHTVTQFFEHLFNYERTMSFFFKQDNATTDTTNN